MGLKIGALAARTGANAPTIRYYEEIGLLPRPDRRDGGQRAYGDADVRRLTFIRRCREFGFPIEQVRGLVDLFENDDRSCLEARDLARDQLNAVRAKMAELRELELSLAKLVDDCDAACVGGPGSACVIFEDLVTSKPSKGCCGAGNRPGAGGGRAVARTEQRLVQGRFTVRASAAAPRPPG